MEKFHTLGLCLLFSLVILHESQQYDSHLGVMVNIDVNGRDVVKTGIRNYTFASPNDVTITCSSLISSAANISLLNSNRQPIISNVSPRNGITVVTKRLEQPQGKYYCLLSIPIWSSNDSYSEFVMLSEVDIIRESVVTLYASSVGNSGYGGERVHLYKKSGSYFYSCCQCAEESLENEREFFIHENFPEEKCVCSYCGLSPCNYCPNYDCDRHWNPKCSVFLLSVYPSLELNISVENETSDSSLMGFSCNSTPPRLIYWKVLGSHGNLFDFDNIDHSISVNMTVNITQSPGKTILRIWEAVPGGNGIHTVMCSTYDTDKRVVARLTIAAPSVGSPDYPRSDFIQTYMQETTTTITNKSDTTTEIGEHYDDSEVLPSTEQGYQMKTDTLNTYVLIGFVSVPYLVIILMLFGIICCMYHRTRSLKMELRTDVKVDHPFPETVMHDNPAYLSFTETHGCCPENEKDEKTYTNL